MQSGQELIERYPLTGFEGVVDSRGDIITYSTTERFTPPSGPISPRTIRNLKFSTIKLSLISFEYCIAAFASSRDYNK
jgi:hypothetical protein